MPTGKRGPRKPKPAPTPVAGHPPARAPRSNNRYATIQLGVAAALAEELAELRTTFPSGHWSAPDGELTLTQDGKEYTFEFDGDATSRAILLLLNNMSLVTDVLRKKTDESND